MPGTEVEHQFQREMVTLSFISYCGFLEADPGDVAGLVREGLENVEDIVGPQELIWGPASVKPVGRLFDNGMMMVVRPAGDPGKLTVVIRGTNPVSMSAWFQQDFDVGQSTPWVFPEATGGERYSRGASRSLWLLTAALIPEAGEPGAGLTLLEALEAEIAKAEGPLTINVTGHSLGGVMATTLALWLRERLPRESVPHLPTRAFAGPSAGNAAFAAYTNRMLGDYLRIYNHMDIVTHAWNEDEIRELKDLYAFCLDHGTMDAMVDLILPRVSGNGYTQLGQAERIWDKPYKPLLTWGLQAVYQHVVPYLEVYDLDVPKMLLTIGFPKLAWEGFDPIGFMKQVFNR